MKGVQELSGTIVVDFAEQKALDDLCQGLLYGFWVVQRYAIEPALAGALGNSPGTALVLAVMKSAEAQPAAGWALAAGAVFVLVLAFGCVDDGPSPGGGFLFASVEVPTPLPRAFCKLFRISGFAGFRPQLSANKRLTSSSHGTTLYSLILRFVACFFVACFNDVRVCGGAQVQASQGGVENLYFVLRHGVA